MKEPPAGLDPNDLAAHLSDGWGLTAAALVFAPVGFGSYHWIATTARERLFITVDDLDAKPWLGGERDTAFVGLGSAFGTAQALRREGGLEFVAAPLPHRDGAMTRRIGDRYALSVAPFIEGTTGDFGTAPAPGHLSTVVEMLARLHEATPLVQTTALRRSFEVPDRVEIENALADLESPWEGGPFSEPARRWVETNAGNLMHLLGTYDHLRTRVERQNAVITHGEPHAGNLLWGGDHPFLIDWDTVALAPPERDLWLVGGDPTEVRERYSRLTGRGVDEDGITFYSVGWQLTDLASFLKVFRHPHEADGDTEYRWRLTSDWRF